MRTHSTVRFMSDSVPQYIQSKLQQRQSENNFRSLTLKQGLVDFTSNDYLGLSRNAELHKTVLEEVKNLPLGSTGSRLLSGNSQYVQDLETYLAQLHQSEDALLFNSGFDANYGLLSTLPYRGHTIVYDELVHASMHDGIKASKATGIPFKHDNVSDLEVKLQQAEGLKYVVVESLYSMDGDYSPLKEIAALCEKYNAALIVDEAHATGILGSHGTGRILSEGLQSQCLVRIHTFGKAIGGNGAVVLCSSELKSFLVNYCRPFIFSTALPFYNLAHIKCAYQWLQTPQAAAATEKLFALIKLFRSRLTNTHVELLPGETPVQSVVVTGNDEVRKFATAIQQAGFDVRPILSPTVPRGRERIRICIHSFNSEAEVVKLAETINKL